METQISYAPEFGLQTSLKCCLTVLYGPHAARTPLLKLCARTSLNGIVRVLDFGNHCDMYFVAKELRFLTNDPVAALTNIHLSRAFTCHQAEALLAQNQQLCDTPILILDLLSGFLDESVSQKESERLFEMSLYHIREMAVRNPVFCGIRPILASSAARASLLYDLRSAADNFLQIVAPEDEGTTIATLPSDDRQMCLF